MRQKTQWICDGCGETAVTARDKTPGNWHQVTVTWTGLKGYPSSIEDGTSASDLCGDCSSALANHVRPHCWPRLSKPREYRP